MTVRELRQMLFDLPGNLPVLVFEHDHDSNDPWLCQAEATVATVMDINPAFKGASYAIRETNDYAVVIQ